MSQAALALEQPLRLGDLLLQAGLINEQDLKRGLDFQQRFGGRLGAVLVRIGAISEDSLLQMLSQQLGLPVLEQEQIPFDAAPLLELIDSTGVDKDWWLDQQIIVWQPEAMEGIHCVARDPLDDSLHEVLERVFHEQNVTWFLARNQDIDRLLDVLENSDQSNDFGNLDDIGHLRELAEGAPVVEFVNNMLSQAIDQRASDVHVEPEERQFYVRYRVDGVLREHLSLPRERFDAIASRIKLIAALDIAERRLPQDGRLNIRVSGQELDIRVSTLPGVHGESVVMRLLPKERETSRLEQLGFAPDHYQLFTKWVGEPHGIILVTGPTGSGKSTTLYATLDAINDRKRKIITVEDPVEYQLPHVTQVQAHSDIGYTFAHALRAILRQDPDIIMLGEIRDRETAEIAIQASLTGHMVLSTLHTNDSVSAFTRLIDMGVEPFLVATSVRAVQAQRLVRVLCPHCAEPHEPLPEIVEETRRLVASMNAVAEPVEVSVTELVEVSDASPLRQAQGGAGSATANWKQAVGCEHCQHTGYRGRVGIYELTYLTPELQSLVLERAHASEMRKLADQQGYRTLRQDGWIKAWQGITSVEEVLRVTESAG